MAFNASENILRNGWWEAFDRSHGSIRKLISDLELCMPSDQIPKEPMLDNNFSFVIPDREERLGELPI